MTDVLLPSNPKSMPDSIFVGDVNYIRADKVNAEVARLKRELAKNDGVAPVETTDSERLDWVMRNVSGKEWRRLGIVYPDGMTRADLDARAAVETAESPSRDQLLAFANLILAGCTDEIYNGRHPHELWEEMVDSSVEPHGETTCDSGIPSAAEVQFTQWLQRQIPPGTVVSSPTWWAPRIFRAVQNAMRGAQEATCEHGFRKGRCTFCVKESPVEPTAAPKCNHSLNQGTTLVGNVSEGLACGVCGAGPGSPVKDRCRHDAVGYPSGKCLACGKQIESNSPEKASDDEKKWADWMSQQVNGSEVHNKGE